MFWRRAHIHKLAEQLAGTFGGKIEEQCLSIGMWRTSPYRVATRLHGRICEFNPFWQGIQINLKGFRLCVQVLIALNKPDSIYFDNAIGGDFPDYGMPIYTSTVTPPDMPAVRQFLQDKKIVAAIKRLKIREKEYLHIMPEMISLHHLDEDIGFLKERLDLLGTIIDLYSGDHDGLTDQALVSRSEGVTTRYADSEGVEIDEVKVPESLRPLIPFAKKWAISDDSERTTFQENIGFEEKKKFVDLVWPLMDEIEAYCSQLENEVPVPDEVVLFQMMMEATTEVYYEVYSVK